MGQRTCGQKAVNMVNVVSGNAFILVNKVYLVKCKKMYATVWQLEHSGSSVRALLMNLI